MSNLPLDLNDRRVVIATLTLLGLVLSLNWRVFQPGGEHRVYEPVPHEDTVALPEDLDEQARMAARHLMAATVGIATPALPAPQANAASRRDPFRKAVSPKKAKPRRRKSPRVARPARKPLHCEAVLVGSGRPTALINGVPYSTGDQIRGHTLERVGEQGAWLRKGDQTVFLPVGANPGTQGNQSIQNTPKH